MERFELQIGDLVNFEGKLVEVASLDLDDVVFLRIGERTYQGTVCSKLKPISLSDDWFKECGFQCEKGKWVYEVDPFTLVVIKRYGYRKKKFQQVGYDASMYCAHSECECVGNKVEAISYVHQLQHFIRLCWVGEHPKDGKYLTGNKYKGE